MMANGKFIAIARNLGASRPSQRLSEEDALLVAIEIAEALVEAGMTAEDFLEDAFDLHPFWQVPKGTTIH